MTAGGACETGRVHPRETLVCERSQLCQIVTGSDRLRPVDDGSDSGTTSSCRGTSRRTARLGTRRGRGKPSPGCSAGTCALVSPSWPSGSSDRPRQCFWCPERGEKPPVLGTCLLPDREGLNRQREMLLSGPKGASLLPALAAVPRTRGKTLWCAAGPARGSACAQAAGLAPAPLSRASPGCSAALPADRRGDNVRAVEREENRSGLRALSELCPFLKQKKILFHPLKNHT